jgi:sugar/nucleoside kinase (ribokinase family)
VPDLIVVGDVMVDVGVTAGELARGGDVHGEVRIRPGGTATNAAAWAASAGASVRVHGRVGDDVAGRIISEALRERGIEPALTVDPDVRTGSMLVVHQAAERSMVADRGANARLSPDDLPARLEAGAVLVSGYLLFHPGSEPAARAALDRAGAEHVAVDAASWPLVRGYGREALLAATASATILLANAAEAEVLTGDPPEAAAAKLAVAYGRVVVKDGAAGAVIGTPDGAERVPATPVREINPTGAGDAFDGVLLTALARGASFRDAVREGCAAGARAAASAESWPEGDP